MVLLAEGSLSLQFMRAIILARRRIPLLFVGQIILAEHSFLLLSMSHVVLTGRSFHLILSENYTVHVFCFFIISFVFSLPVFSSLVGIVVARKHNELTNSLHSSEWKSLCRIGGVVVEDHKHWLGSFQRTICIQTHLLAVAKAFCIQTQLRVQRLSHPRAQIKMVALVVL